MDNPNAVSIGRDREPIRHLRWSVRRDRQTAASELRGAMTKLTGAGQVPGAREPTYRP